MKGQAKRFVDQTGKAYKMHAKKTNADENIGFLSLWRYASWVEVGSSLCGVVFAWLSSCALLAAVSVYGELTALFVQRHRASQTPAVYILPLFGGGRQLPAGNRTIHMDALVDDSVAFAWASVAIMAAQLTTAAVAVMLANWSANRMVSRLRWRLLRSVITQEIAFFDTNTNMNFAITLTEDMDKLKAGVGEHVSMTAFLSGTVVLGSALSLSYGWELTLAGLAVVPVAITVAAVVAKYQTKWSAEEVKAYGAAGKVVEEAFNAIKTVRAYAGEQKELDRYSWCLGSAQRAGGRRALWAGAGAGLGWLLTYALNAVVFAYGAVLCVRDLDADPHTHHYHPGVMLTILFCTFMAAQNIAMCQPHLEIFSSARGAAKSVYKILERKSQTNALESTGTKPASFRGDIRFDNLYFNYPSRPDVKVLRGLTLSVKAGETIALVGGSGCGKSTLLQLLQRLYEPDSGTIAVDEHQLTDLDLRHFRSSIGVVGQEPVLFSGTIRDNIAIGRDVTMDDVIAAAKTANAHQFIVKLAQGYDTPLGANGASLSGGQKQRVAIARALVRDPRILLLDEPTSALDPGAERQVQAALDAASKGRTTLVVSHRLSTIVNASRIVYMEQGSVLEQGTHQELLQNKGPYWRLVQDDLTHKSATAALMEEADDDDVTAPMENFRRTSLQRRSTIRGSMSRRISRRMGSMSADIGADMLHDVTEVVEEEEEEDVPDVSSWQLLKLNKPEWKLLVGGAIASLLVGATMPTFALLLSKLYGMFAWSDREAILRQSALYAGLFAACAAVCGAVTFLQAALLARAGAALTARLRTTSFYHYLLQEQAWFDSRTNSVGALCARLATDCAAVQGATGSRLGTILQGSSTMIIGVALAMAYSWKMTLVSLLSVPCVIGGIYLESYVTRKTEKQQAAALESASRVATEAVLNVRTVQSLGVEETMLQQYGAALEGANFSSGLGAWMRGGVYGLCLCAPTLGYAVSLAYGGYLIAREGLHYEYAVLVSEALIYGAWMLAEALSFAPSFAAARRAGARILHALDRTPAVRSEPSATHHPHWSAKGELTFSEVKFSYPTRPTVPVLQGLNLSLPRGQTLALVGASGCGKSTIVQLLMRSYDPDSGTLLLDGRDMRRDIPLSQLRSQLGLVQQEPALFSRSIRDNIAYGDNARDVPLEDVIDAANKANVHNFIAGLPLGYDTVLGSGAALSGGQKQRVAIARALVRDPRLLLLDEATSALDANSERSVQQALEAASEGRSTVVIAHRLATVRRAHQIAVLNKGVVAEIGTHEELVRKRGLYWDLLKQQGPADPS